MSVDVRDERLLDLVPKDVSPEKLGEGFTFTEGPVWHPDGYLLFSDVIANARHRWDLEHGFRQIAQPTGHCNGMTFDGDGRLVVCEGNGAITRMAPSGDGSEREVLAATYRDESLNSPNDIVVASDGSLYFTDPWTRDRVEERAGHDCDISLDRELPFNGVFRFSHTAGLQLLIDDIDYPNGLCFSPDESMLYVNDTSSGDIYVYDVQSDGSLGSRRTLVSGVRDDTEHVDGMKCDEFGNIWVTGPDGVWVIDDGGVHLGTIQLPQRVGNMHWGGPDWTWLFIADSTAVYRLLTNVRGRREPFMN